eukprot:CAMPEP_0206437790 /NCGR_PEP_ID=MMETSP0324_2-20121206/11241_1 /ASSEMBLY_ACC=CAM_ASM_000836 /TAXON_ID=2866 /ORGANISM="Crypthecodinium cohnii, Strain Seligo" /LENGTH=751 /DNA_ID=CAMNT_0053905119 /DNA_START=140 /DNA_END=2393 /DNA_ORIENTATION=+
MFVSSFSGFEKRAASGPGGGGAGGGATATTKFSFGKHNGKTFKEVMDEEPGYVAWAMNIENPKGVMKDFVTYCKANGKGAGDGSGPGLFAKKPAGGAGPEPKKRVGMAGDPILICELVSPHNFRVVCEAPPKEDSYKPSKDRFKAPILPAMPQHIWRHVGTLPEAKQSPDGKGFQFPMRTYYDTVARLEALDLVVEPVPQWVRSTVQRCQKTLPDGKLDETRLPKGLLPYQLEGVHFGFRRSGRCLIGDEMGLGKTVQALALANQYPDDWPVLVICPSSLRLVWREQILEWLPAFVHPDEIQVLKKGTERMKPDVKFYIISYNLLSGKSAEHFAAQPNGAPFKSVILDESHNIKEWKTARTKAIMPILKDAQRAVLLSGTPTRNSAHELHTQLCGVLPFFGVKFGEFKSRYCLTESHHIGQGRMATNIVGVRNAAELHNFLTSTVMIRRLKKDVLQQLPEKRRQRIPLEVTNAKFLKELFAQKTDYGVAGFDRYEDYVPPDGAQSIFQQIAQMKLPAIKEHLQEALEASDQKVIVFAHHKFVMEELSQILGKKLGSEGKSHIFIDGSVSMPQRHERVKKFQEDPTCQVALLSITACSEGITLTAAERVVFAELYWVPGVLEQAEARAHRIGSKHSRVLIEYLVIPGSPDESIYWALQRKAKDTNHVMNGVSQGLAVEHMTPVPNKKRQLASSNNEAKGPAAKAAKTGSPNKSSDENLTQENETPPPVAKSKVERLLAALNGSRIDPKPIPE